MIELTLSPASAAMLRAVGLEPDDPITRAIALDERQAFNEPLDPPDVRTIAHERYLASDEAPGGDQGPHWDAYIAAVIADEARDETRSEGSAE
jgi:hypothetical protein